MAKIFRKARKDSLSENKTVKYLKYALGEVILVVIGILIALNINNWNEKRKLQKKLDNTFALILEDIKADTLRINAIIDGYSPFEDTVDLYLSNKITFEEFMMCQNCFAVSMNINPFEREVTGLQRLKTISSDFSNDTLVTRVVQGISTLSLLEDLSGYVEVSTSQNLEYWRNNYDWYSGFVSRSDYSGFLAYLKTQEFKNRLAHNYLLIYGNYIPNLQNAKIGLDNIAHEIIQWRIDHGYLEAENQGNQEPNDSDSL